jgi:Leucine-rich repeat (LRR) protein
MKKTLILLLLSALCMVSCKKDKVDVWVDESPIIDFKDPRFMNALMEISDMYGEYPHSDGSRTYKSFKDMNGDGKVSEQEAARVEFLDLNGYKIRNIDELGFFTSLEILYCQNNLLENIDVSKSTRLKELNCMGNRLSGLDISKSSELESLNCSINSLSVLDVSNCKELKTLDCSDNQLTRLDVSECKELRSLNCSDNQISSLDVSKCKYMESLSISNNPIKSLTIYQYYILPESFIDSYKDIIEYSE